MCKRATSLTSTTFNGILGTRFNEPFTRFLIILKLPDTWLSNDGPNIATGLIVANSKSLSLFLTKSHAAFSANNLDFS